MLLYCLLYDIFYLSVMLLFIYNKVVYMCCYVIVYHVIMCLYHVLEGDYSAETFTYYNFLHQTLFIFHPE